MAKLLEERRPARAEGLEGRPARLVVGTAAGGEDAAHPVGRVEDRVGHGQALRDRVDERRGRGEAEQRIAGARAGALEEIETVASEAAGDIVARLAGVTVDAAAARVAVKEALNG